MKARSWTNALRFRRYSTTTTAADLKEDDRRDRHLSFDFSACFVDFRQDFMGALRKIFKTTGIMDEKILQS